MNDGILLTEIKEGGHTDSITSFGFLPGNTKEKIKTLLYSVSWDGTLRVSPPPPPPF